MSNFLSLCGSVDYATDYEGAFVHVSNVCVCVCGGGGCSVDHVIKEV